jgi:multidrug resistance efflux pump
MARVANYEQKIELIQAKIAKKTEEIKALKAQVAALEAKKTKTDFKVLNEYLVNKGVAPEEALGKLKEVYGE